MHQRANEGTRSLLLPYEWLLLLLLLLYQGDRDAEPLSNLNASIGGNERFPCFSYNPLWNGSKEGTDERRQSALSFSSVNLRDPVSSCILESSKKSSSLCGRPFIGESWWACSGLNLPPATTAVVALTSNFCDTEEKRAVNNIYTYESGYTHDVVKFVYQ